MNGTPGNRQTNPSARDEEDRAAGPPRAEVDLQRGDGLGTHGGSLMIPSRRRTVGAVLRRAVLRQLPMMPWHFTGRQRELEMIASLSREMNSIDETVAIGVIDGMAGVGKTALAIRAGHMLADQYPDGQLFIDLHGYTCDLPPRTVGNAVDFLLNSLNVPSRKTPREVELRAALYRERLVGTRTLIVLDNAASEEQVRLLLPASAGCLVLVTSRRRLKGIDDAFAISLATLAQADSIALVRSVAGLESAAQDDSSLAEIAEMCGQLPLALRMAGLAASIPSGLDRGAPGRAATLSTRAH